MIIEVPVCGPQAHLCPLHGAGGQCLGGCNSLHCAETRRTESVRVRCWHDAQGRECPALQSCALEHWIHPNTCRLRWIQGESHVARACFSRVGVGAGLGINWANHGLVLVGAVCGGGDSDWYIPGPVYGIEWRRRHNVADRRAKKANNPDFPGLEAVTTATPRTDHAGKGAGPKRPGKKARERLRRREAGREIGLP